MRWAWRILVGAVLCQALPLSVIAVGWTQRWMQRETLQAWHRQRRAGSSDFTGFASADAATAGLAAPPTWLRSPGARSRLRCWLGGLWKNARLGLEAAFNTWVLTLPGCVLWLFAWHAGWNNSFHKGYEQAAVGPLLGWLGIALFIAAMLYVPLAQARQAATGRARAFYDFALVWGLARRRWGASLRLAASYAAVSLPVMALKTAPIAFDRLPGYADWDDAAIDELLGAWFLGAGAFVFAAFVLLRRSAARIYADAVIDAIRVGALPVESLEDCERETLSRLGLLRPAPRRATSPAVAALRGAGSWTVRNAAAALCAAFWFAFVAQIFVSEFLHHHPAQGWLNQPLVQLPYFDYAPPDLSRPRPGT